MTPEQAAWVREYVWPSRMRHNFPPRPGICSCTWGPCDACQHNMHRDCVTGDGVPVCDVTCGHVVSRSGRIVAPVVHLSWQRPCRLWCPCLHRSHARHRHVPQPAIAGEQLGLFGAVA
jgi:hypothetical protein